MSSAAEIQWSLLPPLAMSVPQVAVAGILEPAYNVAGDSSDYALNEHILHVATIDAMGHRPGCRHHGDRRHRRLPARQTTPQSACPRSTSSWTGPSPSNRARRLRHRADDAPQHRNGPPESGRGIALTDRLPLCHGAEHTTCGKCVWAEVPSQQSGLIECRLARHCPEDHSKGNRCDDRLLEARPIRPLCGGGARLRHGARNSPPPVRPSCGDLRCHAVTPRLHPGSEPALGPRDAFFVACTPHACRL
ncbi:hypothetical protein SAMN05428954_3864 [Streptomyces sp. 2112.3]|nr:hypothetical protein BX261_3388 [Streptomyces sp. 2321.6]SDR42327.1 hypothetical protein SAMN05216511_3813 [Streptomyces sp. KS_16]SEC96746.1 hypothetical protein SAMN05428940_3390 [Streptomyces sp. 2133.1]SEE78219.1 hypothetical protein SAMN05428954_3864 [Streptomyces sp. 2112.3]SNC69520.1 hypothetical protein SAMN06272741_3382 [Streptomyces sp. 2114.4]